MFKLWSPCSTPIETLFECFFSTTQNGFWTHRFWCLLVLLPFFVSPLPHQQNISLWGPFSSGETKKEKSHSQQDQVSMESGARGSCHFFGQKVLNPPECFVGRCVCKSPIMKWANTLKGSSKKIHWSQMQPLNVSWYTDTDGFLEH